MNKRGMLAQLIGLFVVIIIAVSLLPAIANQIQIATNSSGMLNDTSSTWAVTTLNLVPGFFAICIIGIAIIVAWNALKPFFESESSDEDDEDDEEEEDEPEEDEEEKQPTLTTHKVNKEEKYKKTEEVVDMSKTKTISIFDEKELNKKYKKLERSKFD